MITIEILDGFNFKKWKEDVEFAMEMADVHTALYTDKPADLTEESTEADRAAYAIWEKSNRICLLSMKRSIKTHLKSSMPIDCTAKELMTAISQRQSPRMLKLGLFYKIFST